MNNKFKFCSIFLILLSFMFMGCSLFDGNKQNASAVEQIKKEAVIVSEKTVTKNKITDKEEKIEDAVLIKKSEYTLLVYKDGEMVLEALCAVGKNFGQKTKRGDLKTPTGIFYVDEIIDSSYWTHDFGDGKGEIEGAYGPWFISLDTMHLSKGEWDGIGIHGTHDNSSLGTMASEGCIRLSNENIEKLKDLVKVGTKVIIEE